MQRPLAALLILALLGATLCAQEGQTAKTVAELLKDLGAADYSRREQASEELLRRGESVVPDLQRAQTALPLEGRLRVEAILARITRATETVSFSLEPTLVTLDLEDEPMAAALAALGSAGQVELRSGSVARGRPSSDPPPEKELSQLVSLKVSRVPFFKALDTLCQEAGMTFRRDARTGAIMMTPGTPSLEPIIYPGPFRAEMRSFSVTRQLLSNGEDKVHAYMQIQVDVERGTPLLGVLSPLTPEVIEDDQGRSLMPEVIASRFYMMSAANSGPFNLSIGLLPPGRDVKRLKRVVCPLKAVVKTKVATARLRAPFTSGMTMQRPGVLDLRLDAFDATEATTRLTVSFAKTQAEGDVPAGTRVNVEPRVTYVLAGGTEIRPGNVRHTTQNDRIVSHVTLATRDLAEIEVHAVQSYETRAIPLVFENVRVP